MKKKLGRRIFSFVLSLMMVFTALCVGGVEDVKAAVTPENVTLGNSDFSTDVWNDTNNSWSIQSTPWDSSTRFERFEYASDSWLNVPTGGGTTALKFYLNVDEDFSITQTINVLPAGEYTVTVPVMGENAEISVKLNGQTVGTATLNGYNSWHTITNTITIDSDVNNATIQILGTGNSGAYGYIDRVDLVGRTVSTNTEGYKVVITADDASVDVDDTISLSAKVTYNGTEITDLAANNLKLWWWVENTSDVTLSEHDSTNGLSRTAKATMLTAGTYKVYATLKDSTDTEQYKGEISLTAAGPAPVYEFSIAADKTEVAPGETVKLTATVKKDGVEVTDLEAAGLHIWWSHDWSNGEQDAVYDSASSRNLTCDVKVTSEGEYYFSAKLQDNSWTDIDQKYVTLKGKVADTTETTDANSEDAGVDEQTEEEQGANIELVNANFTSALDGTWTGTVNGAWGNGNSIDVVSYSSDAWLELPSYVGTTGLKFSMNHGETMTISQWLTELPAGTYTITAPVMGENTDIYLVLGDQEIKATSLSGYNNWSKARATFTITEDMTDVKVGFKLVAKSSGSNYSWGWIDSISLVKGVPATGDTTNVMGLVALMVTGVTLVGYTMVKRRKVNF